MPDIMLTFPLHRKKLRKRIDCRHRVASGGFFSFFVLLTFVFLKIKNNTYINVTTIANVGMSVDIIIQDMKHN